MSVLSSIRRALARPAPAVAVPARGSGGWLSALRVREPYSGAWQLNDEIGVDTALSYFAVNACVTLIAQDIGKLRLRLVEENADGIWNEIESPAFSPVLRKPNRYQRINTFVQQWQVSKLTNGNTYALKERNDRGNVRAMYILDPSRVTPLVTPSGDVYYQLTRDDLAGIPDDGLPIIAPASEIIHDLMVPLFHPLVGVSPIFACALAALQGLSIQKNSSKFFANGSNPGGVLTAPGAIADDTAKRLKDYWDQNFSGDNAGKVAVLGDGLKYEAMALTAVEAQLIEQLKFSAETVCSCFHVPAYFILSGIPVPYQNTEPLFQQYYSQCLQSLINGFEGALDEGLELPAGKGTEFDIDDLIWLDHATKTAAADKAIGSGAVAPNEARKKYYGLGPVVGGETPYMQQQNYSLSALAARDASDPFAKPAPPPVTPPPAADDPSAANDAAIKSALWRKDFAGLYAA